MASVETWSTTPASNTTLGGISTDGNVTLVNQIDNIFRGMMSEVATSRDDGTISAVFPRGHLHGLTTSNNAGDATNDIDIAAGQCAADTTPFAKMVLASALTKRLDAAWAVGTGNGGLDTGAIADTWYHIFVIKRPDTGVVDALFSASPTAPTMPANYTLKRRIWSVKRVSGALLAYRQYEDTCKWVTPITDRTSNSAVADILLAVSAPTGIKTQPLLATRAACSSVNVAHLIGDGDSATADLRYVDTSSLVGSTGISGILVGGIFTNTSAQVRYTVASGGVITTGLTNNSGYIDTRGKYA